MTPKEHRRLYRLHSFEREAWKSGSPLVCGVDEVGRGPLAGPVVACAVVADQPLYVEFLNDSKVVSEARRAALNEVIRSRAVSFSLGWANPDEIDRVNIYHATVIAMRDLVKYVRPAPLT